MLEVTWHRMWCHLEGTLGAFITDDQGNLVAVKNALTVRAFFNPAFWQYVR